MKRTTVDEFKFLIGYTENNEILIGNIKKTYCDIDNKTTFSFTCKECYCIDKDDIDPEEQIDAYLSCRGHDYEFLYDCCNYWECAPQDLRSTMKAFFWDDVDMYFDTCDDIDVVGYIIETTAFGQIDPREYDFSDLYISDEAFEMLMYCWDNYHMKEIPESDWNKLYTALYEFYIRTNNAVAWVENILA